MQEAHITFEQPLNEYIRICLRVEYLIQRLEKNIQGETEIESAIALESMLEILAVIDRPDLKTRFIKALTQHIHHLNQFDQKSEVDTEKLNVLLVQLKQLVGELYQSPDKLAQSLRESAFLMTIKQHMINPGGACPFAIPAYQLWLQQPAAFRIRELMTWFSAFNSIKKAVALLLQLTRIHASSESLVAPQGFYQCTLDPKLSFHLVRLTVPLGLDIYPEMSIGRHRLIVRFLQLHAQDKVATLDDVPFELTFCLPLASFI